jgi:rhodanese-related sulfurtransferase
MDTWIKQGYETDTVRSISPLAFEKEINTDSNVVDVRAKSEYENGHLLNSQLLPLGNFLKNYENYNANKKNYVHCQGGYRSMIACSLLKRKNINNIVDIQGGFAAISEETSVKIQNELIVN